MKVGSVWRPLPSGQARGKTIRQLFQACAGHEVVVNIGDWYICGTDSWVNHYQKKGKAMSFLKAINKWQDSSQKEMLDVILLPENFADVFEGCSVIEFRTGKDVSEVD